MHCLAMYGNTGFTQQGLEKLNDLTTIFFQHASNHHEQEALKQILEERISRIPTKCKGAEM